ncbi:MAG: kelch repeat-containing protein [Planctomycetota bacterium]
MRNPAISSALCLGAALLSAHAGAQTVLYPNTAPRAQFTVIAGSNVGAPSGRFWGGSATDGTSLFVSGGRLSDAAGNAGSVYYNGLYGYNPTANAWTTLSPEGDPNAPGIGFRQAMAFDPTGNRLVVYGGVSAAPTATTTTYSTCHAFDLTSNTWSQIPNPTPGTTGPLALFDAKMAFDPASGSLVLFGGQATNVNTSRVGDTWLLSGTTWTQVTGLTPGVDTPTARALHAMCTRTGPYGDVILVGGQSTANVNNTETWRWNGTAGSWSPIAPANASVPATWASGQEMVYDSIRDVLVIIGGPGTNVAPSNTTAAGGWVSEYDNVTNTWRAFGAASQATADPVIGTLQRFPAAFVNGAVHFWYGQNPSSVGDSTLSSVKSYQANPLASALPYGSGCNGLALAAGSAPWGGRDWTLTGSGFGATALGALVISLAQASGQLPPPGQTGCDLLVDPNLPLLTVLLLPSAGSASYTVSLPIAAVYGGLPLDSQMFSLDSGLLFSSNGIAGLLGAN